MYLKPWVDSLVLKIDRYLKLGTHIPRKDHAIKVMGRVCYCFI